jgi:hypothetical protein
MVFLNGGQVKGLPRVEREIVLSPSKGEFERSTGPQKPFFDRLRTTSALIANSHR